MSVRMEIVCVGNELLIGKTFNTNASWMAKRATSMGIQVERITVIGDDVDKIAEALEEALQRKPRFLITTGGLGPTFDDKTLEGLAKTLTRNLELNAKALEMVKRKYETLLQRKLIEETDLTPPRIKMARIPEGAKPLKNPVGTAPGVTIDVMRTTFVALPGVPAEMEAIFEESIAPMLRKEAGNLTFFETSAWVENIMESMLAPLIEQTIRNNPYVYVKSHPKGEEDTPHIELHFSTTTDNHKTARNRLSKAIVQLSSLIEENGGRVKHRTKKR